MPSAPLFLTKPIVLHSGQSSNWKIECDSLSKEDLDTLAYIVSQNIKFSDVRGVPQGGLKLACSLMKYRSEAGPLLLVDDVLTTGNSMEEGRKEHADKDTVGVVIFARGKCPDWVIPIFQLNDKWLLESEQ